MSSSTRNDRLPPEQLGLRAASAEDLVELARRIGSGAVISDPDRLPAYGHDETEALEFLPDAVALPGTVEQVQAILAFADERRIPVVARGAGTGLSGGALPVCGGIALALERLNRIRAVDARDLVAEVESGVILADLQQRVEEQGLFYPPDPASRETCQIGGNLAEDSAGPRSCKYGTTRKWVLGLEAVLADGTLLDTGSRCRKDATGYDLTQLLIGSEGTLAVITAATLRLIARPRATLTAIISFPTLESAAAAVERLFAEGIDPAACELMEAAAIAAVAAVEPIPDSLRGRAALILVELDGDDEEALLARAVRLEEVATATGGDEAIVATDAAGQRRLWQVRRAIAPAVKHGSHYKEADTVVPRSRLAELVEAARAAAARNGLQAVIYGHAGDGNLHINLLRGELDAGLWAARRDAAEEEIFQATVALGGRITGEHGVGWTQRRFLPLALSARQIDLLAGLKRLFDPRGILNPGKILP